MASSLQCGHITTGRSSSIPSAPPAVVTPPSLPRMVTTTTSTPQHCCRYIVMTLERASPTCPWGLSLRRNSDGTFCVGDSIRSNIRGCWIVESNTVIKTIHKKFLTPFIKALFREDPILTALSSTVLPAQQILQPGD